MTKSILLSMIAVGCAYANTVYAGNSLKEYWDEEFREEGKEETTIYRVSCQHVSEPSCSIRTVSIPKIGKNCVIVVTEVVRSCAATRDKLGVYTLEMAEGPCNSTARYTIDTKALVKVVTSKTKFNKKEQEERCKAEPVQTRKAPTYSWVGKIPMNNCNEVTLIINPDYELPPVR